MAWQYYGHVISPVHTSSGHCTHNLIHYPTYKRIFKQNLDFVHVSRPSFLYICILPTCSSTLMNPPQPHPPPHHNCHTPSHGHAHSGGRDVAQLGGATVFLPSCWCVSPWERLLDTHLHIGIRETHNWRPENRDEKFILRPEQESKPGENLLEPCMAAQ